MGPSTYQVSVAEQFEMGRWPAAGLPGAGRRRSLSKSGPGPDPASSPAQALCPTPSSVPEETRDTGPDTTPDAAQDSAPVSALGSAPGPMHSSGPSSGCVTRSGSAPGPIPSSGPSSGRVTRSGSVPGPIPSSGPSSGRVTRSGSAPGPMPGSGPSSGCVARSGSMPQPGAGPQQDGYGVVTAGVFLTSASVGANLLNVPQSMAHLGWIGLPVMVVLGLQSCFCSHLLASSWVLVQSMDPALAGPVHQPYPLMAGRVLGPWARHLMSVAVLGVDTLCSVMMLVLASDLVASIVSYAFPPAQPTVCLLILLMATFLCPFTWFESPKNFWMVPIIGLSTSLSAWLLMLMKMCADYCHRPSPPARLSPSPLRMLVGMSGITNCFTSGGVQPTIQADMRDRSAFTSALAGVFLVVSLMVSSTAATSYTLIGSEARSSVLHNLAPGRLLLAIQGLMLLHVLSTFIIYINPLYQEMEEMLAIPEGSWPQYTFRTLCMGLLVLVSEAMPDFSSFLDLLSVLAILITIVVPPLMYLLLTSRAEVDVKLNRKEKAFLVYLVVTGLVYSMVSAFGATSFVFVEQQQGSCFQSITPASPPELKTVPATTPASRAIIFKAQILTFRPPTVM